jgi:hypothetical protein
MFSIGSVICMPNALCLVSNVNRMHAFVRLRKSNDRERDKH